jgi:hypothetical protein
MYRFRKSENMRFAIFHFYSTLRYIIGAFWVHQKDAKPDTKPILSRHNIMAYNIHCPEIATKALKQRVTKYHDKTYHREKKK